MTVGSQRQRILQLCSIMIEINFSKRDHPHRAENKGKKEAALKKGWKETCGGRRVWLRAGHTKAMASEDAGLSDLPSVESEDSPDFFH